LHPAVTVTEPQPNEIRLTPTSDLPLNHYIYLYVTTGLQSTTSVPATAAYWYFYSGSLDDNSLPTIVSAVPYNGAGNVGVNVSPGVVLSKAIDPVSVNSATFQVTQSGTPLAGTYYLNSTDTRVQFVPNAPLPASTNLVMTLSGVLDQVGHPITFSSNFQTGSGPDFTAPTVVWTSIPANGSIPTNSMITIRFSESMDVTTANTSNIRLYDTLLGTNVAATLSWSPDQTIAYLSPTSPLAADRQYYFSVNSVTDLAGNTVSGISMYFYAELTSASSAPSVLAFNPLSGATNVGTNAIIEAQFSGPIDPNYLAGVTLQQGASTIATTPLMSAGNTVLQLVPQAPLSPGVPYTMTIAGVKDTAGNTVATVANSFTTGATYDITNASVVTYDPSNNSTTGTNVIPKVVFNKPLNPITVSTSTVQLVLNDTGQQIQVGETLSANAKEVTLQPQTTLLPNTYYRFYMGTFQDEDGNNASAGWYYFYTGAGAVSSGPTVTVSPLNAATSIPLNAEVIATSSTPIDTTSWTQSSIQVLDPSSTPVAGTVSMTSSTTLAFTPSSNLGAGKTYTVSVSGFTDTDGNSVLPYSGSFTTGALAATGGLTFVSSNISNGATVTNPLQPITLTFSQFLIPTTVNSSTLEVMNGWNSNLGLAGSYVVTGSQVTFTPSSSYPAGATIYVGECGGPTDVLGDVFYNGSCWQQQLVYFKMSTASPDTTPLQVVSVTPANGATNVGRDQPVAVTFNKSVSPGTASGYNTQLYAGQDLQTNGSVTWSSDDRTIYFNSGALYNGTTYTIALPANGITDMSGNPLASAFTSTFTTTTDPTTCCGGLAGETPANGATGIPTNTLLTLYINRQVNPSTLTGNVFVTVNGSVYPGTIAAVASGYEVQYTPTTAFPNSAAVQWWFSGVQDVYGNTLYGNSGTFYTAAVVNAATEAPQVIAVSPAYGASNVPTNAQFDIQYNVPIDPTTLTNANVYIYNGTNGTYPAETITVISPTVVRLQLATPPFATSTYYYACSNTNVKGTNGVNSTSGCWSTYFQSSSSSTPDTTPGTVTIGPPNGVVNVGTNAYIRVQFSKPADRTTATQSNIQVTMGGNPIPGSLTYNTSNGDLYGVNFYPLNPLPPSSVIKVTVTGLLDYAGNTFLSTPSQFTTAALPDYAAPTAAVDFPYSQAGIGTNAVFTCRYSEPIDPSSITTAGLYIYSYTAGARVAGTVSVSSDMLSATITPTAALTANSQFVYYCGGAIDLTGNAQNNNSDGFYTGSGPVTTGPTLVLANPTSGATNVPVNTNSGPWVGSSLGLQFSEPVASNSLGNITLTPSGGSALPIAVYPENGNTFVWVQLPSSLLPNMTYTYGVSGVTDLNGNAMTPVTSSFTTGSSFDFANPTVTAVSPGNGATAISDTAPSISVTFSAQMNPVLIDTNHVYLRTHNTQTLVPTTVSVSADLKTVTLTPTSPLTSATIYDLVVTSNNWYLYDIAGNPFYYTGVQTSFTSQ
jgi:hypothetical protein